MGSSELVTYDLEEADLRSVLAVLTPAETVLIAVLSLVCCWLSLFGGSLAGRFERVGHGKEQSGRWKVRKDAE